VSAPVQCEQVCNIAESMPPKRILRNGWQDLGRAVAHDTQKKGLKREIKNCTVKVLGKGQNILRGKFVNKSAEYSARCQEKGAQDLAVLRSRS